MANSQQSFYFTCTKTTSNNNVRFAVKSRLNQSVHSILFSPEPPLACTTHPHSTDANFTECGWITGHATASTHRYWCWTQCQMHTKTSVVLENHPNAPNLISTLPPRSTLESPRLWAPLVSKRTKYTNRMVHNSCKRAKNTHLLETQTP